MEIGVNGEIGRIVQRLVLAERRIGLEHALILTLKMTEQIVITVLVHVSSI